ncbi:type II secretion system minor pseudopilin GspJ [Dokdonella sp.]|uniref:type II secretion system minor pseudopilin GspJ n=1 Tax=Dokdonella sp. TaxID=2291710 RepID=UPI001B0B8BDF|nr:type II secretion system minor pseudopilin GspJ [Dokdonella sp.]MBO9663878.1 type II secretion system minor pseudopilin GspJ [Dokdonella sp.]
MRSSESPIPNPQSRPSYGFSLIELLVALAVFAALAAAAYGGLAQLARTRGALAAQQDRLAAVTRAVAAVERDLRQAVSRSVLGSGRNDVLPALSGVSGGVELTRLGYANPRAESRSHLERVAYALDGAALRRLRYAVLDRAPDTVPATTVLLDRVDELRLRYLGCDGTWREAWPSSQPPTCGRQIDRTELLPRAVEFRFVLPDLGEIRRLVELPSSSPPTAVVVEP